jgi:hypothetical protein
LKVKERVILMNLSKASVMEFCGIAAFSLGNFGCADLLEDGFDRTVEVEV